MTNPVTVTPYNLDTFGHRRNRVRVRWWDDSAITYRAAALLSDAERAALPEMPLPAHARLDPVAAPLIFGHYWLVGDITLQSPLCACVDYSAGKGGPLVAYRFDGEDELAREKFVWVD